METLSNLDAIDAVLDGFIVCWDEPDTWRVGELGGSRAVEVPRVLSQDGGFCEALLAVDLRRGVCEGVLPGVGLSGELVGVEGRTVDGEWVRGELGRRKGDARGLLKDSGDGL